MPRPRSVGTALAVAVLTLAGSTLALAPVTDHARADLIPPLPIPKIFGHDRDDDDDKGYEDDEDYERELRCSTTAQPFLPRAVSIPDIKWGIPVIGMRRGPNGVPGTPPTTGAGKYVMAFDLDSGIRPGNGRGNALLNAHTWPDGSAIGNGLLAELDEGDRIYAHDAKGGGICYRVSERFEVRARDSAAIARYYATRTRHQLALIVCSGKRLGAGEWTHRTIWLATPEY